MRNCCAVRAVKKCLNCNEILCDRCPSNDLCFHYFETVSRTQSINTTSGSNDGYNITFNNW